MALPITGTLPFSFNKKKACTQAIWNSNFHRTTQCKVSYNDAKDYSQTITRRFANFQPSIWTYDHIQSLSSEYKVRFNTYTYAVSSLHIYLNIFFLVLKNIMQASNFISCY